MLSNAEAYLPPSTEWKHALEFWKYMPKGGLGFHMSKGKFEKSIDDHGLDPKYAPPGTTEIDFLYLNPDNDPLLNLKLGNFGKIISFARMREAVTFLRPRYTVSDTKFTIQTGVTYIQHQAVLYVFKDPASLLTYDYVSYDKTHRTHKPGEPTEEERIAAELNGTLPKREHKSIYLSGLIHGQAAMVPKENIVGKFKPHYDGEKDEHFADRVMRELEEILKRQAT